MFEPSPRHVHRNLLKSSVALIITVAALPAFGLQAKAQEAHNQASFDAFALDPIIVTARREAEEAQNTPVAVTARLGEELVTEQIDDIKDLANGVTNSMFYNNGGPSVSIRGLGYKGIVGLNQESSTGIFVDDIYIGRSWGVPSFLDDLNHAEVVRGSQSTLYGKNTIGGAVNMVSRDPGEVMGAELEGTIASNMRHRVRAAVDMPLIEDKLYSRAYFSMTGRDGFVDNVTTGKKDNN
ncbi:MAG: TonB-dependent receptor plug domain-containing protein, partial [Cohaesibacter sp.]|nr:TonB-dependent receptor plug domain-containing protein [Cohaesibacter sp.]